MSNVSIKNGVREVSTLSLSFFLHVSMIAFYFLYMHQKSLDILPAKTVVMEIATFERPSISAPSMQEPIKPSEPVKQNPVSKPKPMIKKEGIEKAQEALPVTETQMPSTVSEETPTELSSSKMVSEPYERTDFEIIRDKVLSYVIYPNSAKRMRWSGVVQIALEIDTNGFLVKASVHHSSGQESLDTAALVAANRLYTQQLPKPKQNSIVILPIAFQLR